MMFSKDFENAFYVNGANSVEAPPPQTEEQTPPFVHHCCQPSNLAGAPPFAMWCSLEREYVDAAAKQFDYKCSHCGQRITVNVQQWRTTPEPSGPSRLRTLLKRWRTMEAQRPIGRWTTIRQCADELEALIGAVPPKE